MEMAIILPIFLGLLFHLLYLGIWIYDSATLENIVRQGVRYGSVQMAAEPVLDGDKQYHMELVDREAVKEKLVEDIQKQCSEKLLIYRYENCDISYTQSPSSWQEAPNEKVSVTVTVKKDSDFSTLEWYELVPDGMTKKLEMRIEDHSMVVLH